MEYLTCMNCGKVVSSGFLSDPELTDGMKGIVVRAWIECPECIESTIQKIRRERASKEKEE